ncbi:YidC/Oxa1 family membrane protein insertase [Lentimicrobium sp. S6]|uniref:YidC/Oxa1 family membrane protein insertase n=1 Tax=Lentimicrobium sp. S6 TaxID=2735872 RepID=UPI001553712C|nr:YidC/Oxa1 family membrane protein insertase [Lentimicrobium sp. S6]NPD45460.1 membrane protein insertase YidC [Lentimicrobium sp. S6]
MSPFIYIIEQILLFSYSITGNYGISIIILSFSISLLLLPVFIYIEKSKKKDDIVKKKMQPLIDEIKRVYKGQERFYYIKTINRQHNYSSFKALIPILSLLLQIPFFIAAYQFLENFEPLNGVSFWFIPNLSQPDGFLGSINILPIIMTLVNLITVYFYTKNGDSGERKQMLVLAIAFLVLLFNLPSGLVLYWTMNNVFSFFRLFITNPEVFQSKKTYPINRIKTDYKENLFSLRIIFTALVTIAFVSQFIWAFQHNFDDIYLRLGFAFFFSFVLTFIAFLFIIIFRNNREAIVNFKVSPFYFNSLLFLSIYFFIAANLYFSGENKELYIITLIVLILSQFVGYVYTLRAKRNTNKYLFIPTQIILISLLVYQLLVSSSVLNGEEFSFSIAKLNLIITPSSWSDLILPGFLFSFITMFYYYSIVPKSRNAKTQTSFQIYSLSIFYVLGLIFFWNPILSLASFPEAFEYTGIDIIKNNILIFIISSAIALSIYFLIPSRFKQSILILVLIAVITTFINTSIIPIDLGSLQINKFEKEANLATASYYYILEAFILLILVYYSRKILLSKKSRLLKFGLIALNIIIISQSLNSSIQSDSFYRTNSKQEMVETFDPNQDLIRFSKTEKNIVFILPDMFQGWSMNKILKDNPEYKDVFSGFVWYPNTLSISRVTNTSVPGMLGGFEFYPNILNQDSLTSNRVKTTNAMKNLIHKAHDKDFQITMTKFPYTNMDDISHNHKLPIWSDHWNLHKNELNIAKATDNGFKILTQNALFYSAPLFLKPKIYNQMKLGSSETESLNERRKNTWIAKKYNFLRLLPYISTAEDENPNFIMIYSSVPHFPWNYIDDDGVLISDVSPTKSAQWSLEKFALWIKWMKDNEVYDNTKIVIASDHGTTWEKYKPGLDIDNPFKNYEDKGQLLYDMLFQLNALLFVKDYNSQGQVKEDWRMMSNADVNSIMFEEENPTIGAPPKHRTLTGYVSWWNKKIDTETQYNIQHGYQVKNNIFDANNWEKINTK